MNQLYRCRARYQAGDRLALYDRRHGPSPRKAPALEVERVLRLHRERYHGWNVRHFHRFARREHGVTLSYSFVRLALQEAGLVRKGRARGRHRRRREPRACCGELLHLDGSDHVWLTLRPDERQSLIAVIDATKRLVYAQLWPSESTEVVFSALWQLRLRVMIDRKHVQHESPKNFQLDLFRPDDGHFEYARGITLRIK